MFSLPSPCFVMPINSVNNGISDEFWWNNILVDFFMNNFSWKILFERPVSLTHFLLLGLFARAFVSSYLASNTYAHQYNNTIPKSTQTHVQHTCVNKSVKNKLKEGAKMLHSSILESKKAIYLYFIFIFIFFPVIRNFTRFTYALTYVFSSIPASYQELFFHFETSNANQARFKWNNLQNFACIKW